VMSVVGGVAAAANGTIAISIAARRAILVSGRVMLFASPYSGESILRATSFKG
jgi:hypothetical protein